MLGFLYRSRERSGSTLAVRGKPEARATPRVRATALFGEDRKKNMERHNFDSNKIVKCGCGQPMRQSEWRDHWTSCRVARGVPVTEQDIKDLEAYEARRKESGFPIVQENN